MKKFIVCFVLASISMTVSAQLGSMIDDGQSAIVFSAGPDLGYEYDGFSAHLGWSFNSLFDLDLQLIHTNYNTDDQYTYDGISNWIDGTLTWWIMKQPLNRSLTVNLGLKAGFDKSSYTMYNYWVDETNGDRTFYELNGYFGGKLGLDAMVTYWLSEQLFVQPFARVYGETGMKTLTTGGMEEGHSYLGMTSRFGISIVKRLPERTSFFLKPSLLLNTYDLPVGYNISLGYIIAF